TRAGNLQDRALPQRPVPLELGCEIAAQEQRRSLLARRLLRAEDRAKPGGVGVASPELTAEGVTAFGAVRHQPRKLGLQQFPPRRRLRGQRLDLRVGPASQVAL